MWSFAWFHVTSQVALVVKNPPASSGDTRDAGTIPGSLRSPGGGHVNPLQYSCLENPVDRGAWQATVHGVAKSRTWLSPTSSHSSSCVDLTSERSLSSHAIILVDVFWAPAYDIFRELLWPVFSLTVIFKKICYLHTPNMWVTCKFDELLSTTSLASILVKLWAKPRMAFHALSLEVFSGFSQHANIILSMSMNPCIGPRIRNQKVSKTRS